MSIGQRVRNLERKETGRQEWTISPVPKGAPAQLNRALTQCEWEAKFCDKTDGMRDET